MRLKQFTPYLAFGAAITFALAPFLTPFNGFDPSAYPIRQDNPPVQPAGYTFAIWSLIYIWLVISTGIGATIRKSDEKWHPHQLPLFASLAVGTFWLWVANMSPIAATILIWTMLLLALWALWLTPTSDRFLLRAPVGLYAGWLTAASWVSIGLLGAGYGILLDQYGWAIVCVIAAFFFALAVLRTMGLATVYIAGVIWALIGIAVKTAQTTPLIAILAGVGATLLGVAALLHPTRQRDERD